MAERMRIVYYLPVFQFVCGTLYTHVMRSLLYILFIVVRAREFICVDMVCAVRIMDANSRS